MGTSWASLSQNPFLPVVQGEVFDGQKPEEHYSSTASLSSRAFRTGVTVPFRGAKQAHIAMQVI